MNWIYRSLLTLSLLLLMSCSGGGTEGTGGSPGVDIYGQVLDLDSQPLADVLVIVKDELGTEIAATNTAADGTYLFTGLTVGTYALEFSIPGEDGVVQAVVSPATDEDDIQCNLKRRRKGQVEVGIEHKQRRNRNRTCSNCK